MKREFLKNLGLEDDVIDKILDQNMRDIGHDKSRADTAESALADAHGKLTAAQSELEALKKSNGDVAALRQQFSDLQKKYETDIADRDAKLAERDYEDAIRSAIAGKGLKFSSKAAERDFAAGIRARNLELKDGELQGLDDFIKAQKEADPDAFAPDKPAPRLIAPVGGGAPGQPVPANVALAKELGAAKAASVKSSNDVMKNFM